MTSLTKANSPPKLRNKNGRRRRRGKFFKSRMETITYWTVKETRFSQSKLKVKLGKMSTSISPSKKLRRQIRTRLRRARCPTSLAE